MKKIITNLQPLKMRCLLAALFVLFISQTVGAQCVANYTYTVDAGSKSADFTNTSAGGPNKMFWTFDGVENSPPLFANVTVHFGNPGYHYVCLEVSKTNDSTCHSKKCDSIFIPGTSICKADWSYLVDTGGIIWYRSASTGANLQYKWSFDDGSAIQVENFGKPISHRFNRKGAHLVCLSIVNLLDTTCGDSSCKMILNSGNCNANFTYYADTITEPATLNYVPVYTVINTTYLWDFGDGATSTNEYPVHTFSTSGYHLVCLTVTNSFDSCTATFCDSISGVVTSIGNKNIPEGENFFTISPNPVENVLNITSGNVWPGNTVVVVVYNSVGQKIMEAGAGPDSGSKGLKVDTSELPRGFYFVEIRTPDRTGSKKFFK